ncbi:MAG: metallophosphoesterase [Calothrix sp. SM1_5_4]|nr:metallophosphoesterase [Calothrix sp. SM1_5_4]
MIRIAAAGDTHFDRNSRGRLARHWHELEGKADILLLAGDLTQVGHEEEAIPLAQDLAECPVPVVAVLGNHDFHLDQQDLITARLREAGICVLDCGSTVLPVKGVRMGIYGTKGFGGGFMGACCADFGEPETKMFVRRTKVMAENLHRGLSEMDVDYKVVLMHYSPTPETLLGENKEIYPFLGSYLLGEAVDSAGANVIFHGHAHKGVEVGATLGGVPVRNVAQPVIKHAFNLYCLHDFCVSRVIRACGGPSL